MSLDSLIEKGGYLQCQIDVTTMIYQRQQDLNEEIKKLREEAEQKEGLERRAKINELSLLLGEVEALRSVWKMILSLQHGPSKLNQ